MTHGWDDAHQQLSQCGLTHHYACALWTRKRVTSEVYCLHTPSSCSRLPSAVNEPTTTNQKWPPPVIISIPQWRKGRRRVPPLVQLKKNWFCTLFSWFSVETVVHYCDCGSEVWPKYHRCILARFVQCEKPMFLISQIFLSGLSGLPVPIYAFRFTSPSS